ncbi:MAG: hypothetical protein F6J95_021980 [Leptolyngbya sp. SIO1E4]|nr:hypothetical protein [Leptolyngbya sp. SIO1E4]
MMTVVRSPFPPRASGYVLAGHPPRTCDPSTLLMRFIAPPAAPRLIEAIESLL